MINLDIDNHTYVCPYCGHEQSFLINGYSSHQYCVDTIGLNHNCRENVTEEQRANIFHIYSLKCSNKKCGKVTIVAVNSLSRTHVDIQPTVVLKDYPDYIPEQIRTDYKEAVAIIDKSPKAAATLLRRCLQGMIHDFWGIKEKNLNAEITKIKDNITVSQWKAIDGLRKLGNIGAYMEKDVNMIIDIDSDEASKLLNLIELLLEKWYITRHEEEQLFNDIVGISEQKENLRL